MFGMYKWKLLQFELANQNPFRSNENNIGQKSTIQYTYKYRESHNVCWFQPFIPIFMECQMLSNTRKIFGILYVLIAYRTQLFRLFGILDNGSYTIGFASIRILYKDSNARCFVIVCKCACVCLYAYSNWTVFVCVCCLLGLCFDVLCEWGKSLFKIYTSRFVNAHAWTFRMTHEK